MHQANASDDNRSETAIIPHRGNAKGEETVPPEMGREENRKGKKSELGEGNLISWRTMFVEK